MYRCGSPTAGNRRCFVSYLSSRYLARQFPTFRRPWHNLSALLADVAAFKVSLAAVNQRWELAQTSSLLLEIWRCSFVYSRRELNIVCESQLFKLPGRTDTARGLEKVERDVRHDEKDGRNDFVERCQMGRSSKKVMQLKYFVQLTTIWLSFLCSSSKLPLASKWPS